MSDVEPDGDADDAGAATWLGRLSVRETRSFTPEGQASHNQPTNASAYFQELGDGAGLASGRAGAASRVSFADASAFPPGSWRPTPAAWTS